MNITTIIIIITFFAALSEKFSNKPIEKRKGLLKKLKLENITILLLGIILLFQLYENFEDEKEGKIEETKSEENYERIYSTEEKVREVNILMDSILINLKNEVEFTREEFEIIQKLNKDMIKVRRNVKENLSEYRKLNEQYSEQLKIERRKVINAKPNVKIWLPKTTKDSISVAYQFQLINYGQRTADSVEFHAVMVLTDTLNKKVKKVTNLKTNTNVQNILSLPPNQTQSHVANSLVVQNGEAEQYGIGFLLIKYSFFDAMTKSKTVSPISIFKSGSLNEINKQYGSNVDEQITSNIERYFKNNKPKLHEIFFKE